jgi:uncharacterized membrane protein
MTIKDLLKKHDTRMQNLETVVSQSMLDEHFLSTKLHEVEDDEDCTFGEKISDSIAEFGGSWTFILGFCGFILVWIVVNSLLMKGASDPFPFILLNLILSCLAALQAPIIMMSQNRQEQKDRRRARSDFMINLKAEMEIRSLHLKIDLFQKNQNELMAKLINEKKIT